MEMSEHFYKLLSIPALGLLKGRVRPEKGEGSLGVQPLCIAMPVVHCGTSASMSLPRVMQLTCIAAQGRLGGSGLL